MAVTPKLHRRSGELAERQLRAVSGGEMAISHVMLRSGERQSRAQTIHTDRRRWSSQTRLFLRSRFNLSRSRFNIV